MATGESVVPDISGLGGFAGDDVTHVSEYKSDELYNGKRLFFVGCGNSGMEVYLDLCDHAALPSMVVRDAVLPREVMRKSTFERATMLMAWFPLWFVNTIMVFLSWLILGNLAGFGIRRPAIGPLTLKKTNGHTPETAVLARGDISLVPGVTKLSKNSAELTDGTALDVDAVVMATGHISGSGPMTASSARTGTPRRRSPSPTGGRAGPGSTPWASPATASADAVRIARELAQVWREETKPAKRAAGGRRRCISVIF